MTELERRAKEYAVEKGVDSVDRFCVKSDYIAGYRTALADAAKASWDAINQRWPDGTMHDAQEVANTAIRKLGEQ